jgi:hypothetical protein
MASGEHNLNIFDLVSKYVDINKIISDWQRVKSNRSNWQTKWEIIQDQVFPDFRDYVGAGASQSRSVSPQTGKIKNHSSLVSGLIHKIVSRINSLVMDPSTDWLGLDFDDPCVLINGMLVHLSQNEYASRWLSECKECEYSLFRNPESNFYISIYNFTFDWFTIGTSCQEIILRNDTGRIRFNTVSMQDVFVELSGYGDIDTTYRRLMVNAKQAHDLWGERIHPSQLKLLESNAASKDILHEYIDICMPNPIAKMFPTTRYVSVTIDISNKQIVDVGLHYNSKYCVSRFDVAPGEIYGRSYVWEAMPDIMILNTLNKRAIQSADFAIWPMFLAQDATSISPHQLTPRAIIQGLDSQGRPTIQTLPGVGGNFPFLMEYFQAKLNDVSEALVAKDIFTPEVKGMTATEVTKREIQANTRIRPMLVRLEHEYLNRVVQTTLELLQGAGQLPIFPYEETGIPPELLPDPISQIKISFSGHLAKMQKLQETYNNDLFFQRLMQCAQLDPTVLDRVSLDAMVVEYAKIYGVKSSIMNTPDVVQKLRATRQAQQQKQAQMQEQQQALTMANEAIAGMNAMQQAGIGA